MVVRIKLDNYRVYLKLRERLIPSVYKLSVSSTPDEGRPLIRNNPEILDHCSRYGYLKALVGLNNISPCTKLSELVRIEAIVVEVILDRSS